MGQAFWDVSQQPSEHSWVLPSAPNSACLPIQPAPYIACPPLPACVPLPACPPLSVCPPTPRLPPDSLPAPHSPSVPRLPACPPTPHLPPTPCLPPNSLPADCCIPGSRPLYQAHLRPSMRAPAWAQIPTRPPTSSWTMDLGEIPVSLGLSCLICEKGVTVVVRVSR